MLFAYRGGRLALEGAKMKKYILVIAALVCLGVSNLHAQQVLLTFDDVGTGPLSTQYQAQGATFNFPTARDYGPGFTHSGTRAVELCFAAEFCTSTLNVTFTTGQRDVKVFVGFSSQLGQATPVLIKALDGFGTVVAQQTVNIGPSTGPIPVQIPLEVTSNSPNIRQVVAGFAGSGAFNNGLVFDDVSFDTQGPPPACPTSTNPTLTLTQPTPNTTVQINDFLLQGSVTTGAPLDTATLTVTGPGGTKVGNLLNTTVQPFSAPFGATHVNEMLFPGTNTVTVTVHNCHGTSQASSTVNFQQVTGATVKLLGMEITQATQDVHNSVPLIAGKPTVVRLYFSTTGPTITAMRGDLTGFHEGVNAPLLAQSVGTVSVDSSTDLDGKRRVVTGSLNFILSPDFFQPGVTHFWVNRLNVQGPGGGSLTCVGCVEWRASFAPARPLDLVVLHFFYEKSNLTADPGTTMGGLAYLNNVYPIPGGFPTDTSGINLTILPNQSTGLDLPRDNDRMLFLLQGALDDLLAGDNPPPSDSHILGLAPSGSGGVAYFNSAVAFGDTRAVEFTNKPATDPEHYGAIWAQEIGHDFGRMHVSTSHGEMPPTDPAFPYPHGGIGEPGVAITTESWNGVPFVLDPGTPVFGSKHAHDFMSYGAPNDSQDHTFSWVSPFTYEGLMTSFRLQPTTTESLPASNKLVVRGSIDGAGVATLQPFHIVRTAYTRSSGKTGDLSVSLLDASGEVLVTYNFTAHAIENSTTVAFDEFVPWRAGTKQIVLKRDAAVLAQRAVSAHKPSVKVTRPRPGETWGEKATIQWQAVDVDKDSLTYSVYYNSGLDNRWVPIASDITATSATVNTALLVGSSKARVKVRATDGVNTTEAVSAGSFTVPAHAPLVVILDSRPGKSVSSQGAQFTGVAYDPRDGVLPPTSLKWVSDRDGNLGSGGRITTKPLSSGAHVITLTATDSQGRVGTAKVKVMVK